LPSSTWGGALNDVLERALKEADSFKDEYVSTEHLFLAIAGMDRDPAGQLLKTTGRIPRSNSAGFDRSGAERSA